MESTIDKAADVRDPQPEELERITRLYDEGLYLQAYREAERVSPLRLWRSTKARLFAGRLSANLGGLRLADHLLLSAWRRDPDHPEACWFRARILLDKHGPWAALQFMKRKGDFPDADREARSNWLSLHAHVYGRARDFESAAHWLAQAQALGQDDPWIHLEQAALLSLEDRLDDAMRAAQTALDVRPWYRPAVQWLAHFLVQNEQDNQALQLLDEASSRLESYAVTSQLANLQLETGRYAEARSNLEKCVELAPLMDKFTKIWLAARRCDAAYHCGDLEKSCAFARETKGRFYEVQAERLQKPPAEHKRVCLPVGFVRQHHWTCAPATLAAVCRYWSMPGTHLEVAAAITYAGTPNHSERQWAIDNGWYTKEFTVTWDSARAVLDLGIPFTLTTPEVSSSHLQAVIGYDDLRNTVIIRDPGERHQSEMLAEGLDRYRSSGPRGLALVPMALKERLEALTLPDTELYDRFFLLERALHAHDRARAEQICRGLTETAAGHRLAILAERVLTVYDADTVQMLASVEKLLALFPDDLRLQLSKVNSLRDLARRSEYLELLEKLSKQPRTDPACWEQLAHELAGDARQHAEALRWIKRAMRANPAWAQALHTLAGIYWSQRRFEDALEVYRLAACLEDTTEYLARSYFEAARYLGRSEEALAFLRRRFERFGKKSGQPGQSLAWAHFLLEQTSQGYAVLEHAMTLRPDDGELMLAVVDQYVQHGKFTEARSLAVRARKRSHRAVWLRSVASLESLQGNLSKARTLWGRVLAATPLAEDAHRSYALLLAETVGRHAALEHLQAVCARFPYHFRLTQLLMDWRREDGPEAVEEVVRKLIDLHPTDAWAWRQLALTLAEQNRLDEAFDALVVAEPLEPASIGYHGVRGSLLKQSGHNAEARECFRAVLHISTDTTYAMEELINACATPEERHEELAYIEAEMLSQVISGHSLLVYRDLTSRMLEPEDLLESLRSALTARPDLWQAWAAVIRQLHFMFRLDEATQLAQAALERFPLVSELWVDLANVQQASMDEDAAIAALETAHGISPLWSEPLRQLTELYRRREEFDKAQALVERAVARAPLQPDNHAILARFLWNSGKRHQGFDRMRHTVILDPGFESAWDDLCDWALTLNCFQAVVDLARDLTAKRPGEIRSWLRLAQALRAVPGKALCDDQERLDECLRALDNVLALRPWLLEAHDLKAQVLAEAQRWLEAQEACAAPVWSGQPPLALRGRLAWIVHLRGDTEEAAELMGQLVRFDPNYYWGWRNLAEWYEQLEKHAEFLQAAEKLIAVEPYDATHHVRRAEAKRALQDRAGALADYRRALELAPEYLYPAFQLFDMYVEDGNTEAARAILDAADPTEARAAFGLRSLQLALIEKDVPTAVAALEDLCGSGNDQQLEEAALAMEKTELAAEALDVLHRYLGGGATVCKQWIALAARLTSLEDVRGQIGQLKPGHLARLNLAVAYADALAEAGQSESLRAAAQANEALLRSKTASWGQIGSCFSKVLDDERVAAWMHDWQKRSDAQPWMFMNLTLAVRGLDRFEEGAVLNRHVLENFESDYTSLYHRTWLIFDEALASNTAAVAEFFHAHELSELDANHRWIAALTRAILTCLTGTDPAQALAGVRDGLTEIAAELEPIDRDHVFELAYRKTIRHIARICGAAGSDWEKTNLETPVRPKLKPKPGEQ